MSKSVGSATFSKIAILAGGLLASAIAQYTDGPGIGKVTFKDNEVGKRIFSFQPAATADAAQTRNAWMHNGYLIFRHVAYDMSDPRNPKKLNTSLSPIWSAHVYPQHDNYVIEEKRIHDLTDLGDPKIVARHGGKALWRSLQWPIMYSIGSYGGVGDMVVVDFSDPKNPKTAATWNISQTAGFNVGSVIVIGNLMILGGSDRGTGKATLDISDPLKPRLIASVTNGPGMYFAQVYGDRIYTTGPTSNGRLGVYSFADPTNIKTIWTGEPRGMGDYANFQGGFVFGASPRKGKTDNTWTKIAISDITPSGIKSTQEGPVNGRGRRYAIPFGNLLWIGSHTGGGEASLHVHQAEPDNEGPRVLYVNPVDGATRQTVTSRIGFSFSDYIDNRSLMTGTDNIVVRPQGGAPIEGWLSHHMGIVNFTPKQNLQPGTTYEVVVKKGGVRDWSNNTAPVEFISRFSTGGSIAAIKGQRPTAVAKADSLTGFAPLAVKFDAAGSKDPDGNITSYEWDFGDGSTATGTTAGHTFKTPGVFNVTLTIKDNDGNVSSASVSVETLLKPGPWEGVAREVPGRIEAEHFDIGGEDVAWADEDPANVGFDEPSDAFRFEEGVDIQPTQDNTGLYNLSYIREGEWVRYTVDVAHDGTFDVGFRVAGEGAGGTIKLQVDGKDVGQPLAIPTTGGWQRWQTVEMENVPLTKGTHEVKLIFGKGGFNLNWFEFSTRSTGLRSMSAQAGPSLEVRGTLGRGFHLVLHGLDAASLGLDKSAKVSLLDQKGQRVIRFEPAVRGSAVTWHAADAGNRLVPGVYTVVLSSKSLKLARLINLQ